MTISFKLSNFGIHTRHEKQPHKALASFLPSAGKLIHMIVKRCYDFSKILRHFTAANKQDLQLLTVALADETSIPTHAQRHKAKERHEELFPGARNFK